MGEIDIRNERVKKLERLKEAGMEAYPVHTERDTSVGDFTLAFDEKMKTGEISTLAGRVLALRGQGGIMFADITDGTGKTQSVFQKADMDGAIFDLFSETVDMGDFIEVRGAPYLTKRGEKSLKVDSWKMLSKSLLPIPDQWYGLKDEEKILRERYLDVLLNPEVRAMFERKAKFWQSARDFYLRNGFLEVETPILETMPGGADARPFVTHHNALDIEVYLRISAGELWQKKLLVAGFPKVFEIGRIFRNEGMSREHLQDYTQLESYEAFADAATGMKFVQELYRHIVKETYGQYTFKIGDHEIDLAAEWPVINFCEVIQKRFGVDPISCTEEEVVSAAKEAGVVFGEAPNKSRAVDGLWKLIRKTVSGPAFLMSFHRPSNRSRSV